MKPVVKINDVALDSEGFAHVLATGVRSPRTVFTVTNEIDKALAALKNPVTLTLRVGPEGEEQKTEKFSSLYLRSRRRLDPFTVEWALEDVRSELEDVRVSCFFNMTYPTTSVSVGDRPVAGTARFNPTAFRAHTTTVDGTDFFVPDVEDLDKKNNRPWTALEAVLWLLGKGLDHHREKRGFTLNLEVEVRVKDNGFVLQNHISEGRRFPDVLSDLLAGANAVLWIDKKGKWIVDDPYAPPYEQAVPIGGWEGGGWMEATDLTRTAPKRINVSFPIVYEVLLRFMEGGTTIGRSFGAQAIEVENVLQLPDDVGTGKRGEWVTILRALALWNAEGWANGQELSRGKLRRGALSRASGFGDFAGLATVGSGFDPKRATRLARLVSSYRRVFRINPLLVPFIREWEPNRSAIADPVTGLRVASPVWQDYAVVAVGKQDIGGNTSTPIAHNVEFPGRNLLTQTRDDGALKITNTAPARIEVIDPKQGIFEVKFDDMRDLNLVTFIPSNIVIDGRTASEALSLDAEALSEGDLLGLFDLASYTEEFDFAAIVSMSFTAPNSSANALTFKKDLKDLLPQEPAGPECYEIQVPDIQARFEWELGVTTVVEEAGGFQIIDAPLRNENHLKAVADAYISRSLPTFANRVMGLFSAPNYNPQRDQLGGPKSEVSLRLLPSGQFEARHVFPFQVPAPDILTVIAPAVRKAELGRLA